MPPNRRCELPTLLIVDDDEYVLRCLKRQFEVRGFFPIEAADGTAALELARVAALDAAILDERMPGLSGVETLRRLRRNARTRDLPILMLTGAYNEEAERRALAEGADAYRFKFAHSLSVITSHVRRVLQARQGPVLRVGTGNCGRGGSIASPSGPVLLPEKEAVSWDEIRRACWPEAGDVRWEKVPGVLSVMVSHLVRLCAGEIETVRGLGLRLRIQP